MKSKKFLKYFVILMTICSILFSSILVMSDSIEVQIVNHQLRLFKVRNEELKNPLLSYNGTTYISIRDMANFLHRKVYWSDENKSISLYADHDEEHYNIKNPETALTIGKAILYEYFGDKINENSVISLTFIGGGIWDNNYWSVSVIYNPDRDDIDDNYIVLNSDAYVGINPITGQFKVVECKNGRDVNTIVDTF